MTETRCSKCKNTGYLYRKFYTAARCCDCSVGQECQAWDRLSVSEQNAKAAAQAEALRTEARERRHARRAG